MSRGIVSSQSPVHDVDWEPLIPSEQWNIYKCVLDQAVNQQVPFALGGGLAVGIYTGRLRNTKDIDLYILPETREQLIGILSSCGLKDYYDTLPYDRKWIYRSSRDGVIVDVIWSMANQRATVDLDWLSRGPTIRMFEDAFRVIPPEELIWSKLYVLQRDRCDWPDILNLLHATASHLDWDHLLHRLGDDVPLLEGLLAVFSWISPEKTSSIPHQLCHRLGLLQPTSDRSPNSAARPSLLDTRPWFRETLLEEGAPPTA